MGLANGAQIGPYEILAPLGSGGMGEVYRALDRRLGRTVAIKTLPAELANDPKLKWRFEREARTISALDHPHICALYDVGPDYLVMEDCRGKTLAKRIAGGPLPMRLVLQYGIEIADALDKAHRAGIVHRDLKPSNIMITKSGVKILDFGLAKQNFRSDDGPPDAQVTEEGAILGTIQYMAPELLSGQEADARSDIFSLGLVLYEMASGAPAFSGTSKASVIAAILEHDPPHVQGLAPLDRLVRACLTKDPAERMQSAHDVLLQLRSITDAEPFESTSKQRLGALQLSIVIGLIAAAIAGVIAWKSMRPATQPVHQGRFQLQPPAGVMIEAGPRIGSPSLAVSPDGQWVAFSGRYRDALSGALYLRSTKQLDARLVMGSAGARDPFFSPNSKWLGFFAGGFLQKVSVDGVQPARICPVKMSRGASWGDDGTILFADGQRLLRVSAEGGNPVVVTDPALPERHRWPQFLPGSKHALVTIMRGLSDRWRSVGVLSLADGRIRPLVPGTRARYAGDRIIYGYSGTLFSVPFDREKLRAAGEPRPVLDDVYFLAGSGLTAFDLSAGGSLVYIPGAQRARDAEIVWIDRQGKITKVVEQKKPYTEVTLSPDGKRVAATARETVEDRDLWIIDLERGGSTRLTTGMQSMGSLAWLPDGRSLVFSSVVTGYGKLVLIAGDGSGTSRQLTSGDNNSDAAPSVSPDGKSLVFMRSAPPDVSRVMAMSLTSQDPPREFAGLPGFAVYPAFSPDGRWVAYESDETGQSEVHVRPFPAGEPRVTITLGGGQMPFWSRDGRELFYRKGRELWSVRVSVNGGFHAFAPKRLFAADWLNANPWDDRLEASPDGETFLAVRQPPEERPERRIIYAPNWIAELK